MKENGCIVPYGLFQGAHKNVDKKLSDQISQDTQPVWLSG